MPYIKNTIYQNFLYIRLQFVSNMVYIVKQHVQEHRK